jgi:hypothetical protein
MGTRHVWDIVSSKKRATAGAASTGIVNHAGHNPDKCRRTHILGWQVGDGTNVTRARFRDDDKRGVCAA